MFLGACPQTPWVGFAEFLDQFHVEKTGDVLLFPEKEAKSVVPLRGSSFLGNSADPGKNILSRRVLKLAPRNHLISSH
jgi:hypothetical protein